MDGSKFKAVNNRDRNFTKGKIASRLAHLEAEVGRYIEEADRIDRQETGAARTERAAHLTGRYHRIRTGDRAPVGDGRDTGRCA